MINKMTILCLALSFTNQTYKAGQANTLKNNLPMVCSYKCKLTFTQLSQMCKPADARPVILAPDVNPYDEFDSVISSLRAEASNPFQLAYVFSSCTSICNAASMTSSLGRQIIYYNQSFLNKIGTSNGQQKWAVRCIIAHEIGHHVLGHTLPENGGNISLPEKRRREARADFFAGFVIRHFQGSTEENALEGLKLLDDPTYFPKNVQQENTADYPTLEHRRQATIEGFQQTQSDGITISMFKRIDSVATVLFNKYKGSQIYHLVDKAISKNDLVGAQDLLQLYLTHSSDKKETDQLLNIYAQFNKMYGNLDGSGINNDRVIKVLDEKTSKEIIDRSKQNNANPTLIKIVEQQMRQMTKSQIGQ
jgi:predicted Zn-dependent protease with MMP-like domain